MGDQKGDRRLAFYEIGKGTFATEMQNDFEQAQIVARETNNPVILTAKIAVYPPDANDTRFGRIAYEISTKLPPRKSMAYTTELKDGLIVNDGENVADAIQEHLQFKELGLFQKQKPA